MEKESTVAEEFIDEQFLDVILFCFRWNWKNR